MLVQIITSLHIFICLLLIVLVLLQQGKGADAGVTLGGGGNTVFGAAGADNFITRFTTVLACCFMITSVYLGIQSKPNSPTEGRLFKGVADSAPITEAPKAEKSAEPITSNEQTQSSAPAESPVAEVTTNSSAANSSVTTEPIAANNSSIASSAASNAEASANAAQ